MKVRFLLLSFVPLLLTACGVLSSGKVVLPEAENLQSIVITANQLNLTITDADSITQLLELLKTSARQNTGKPSIQDVPNQGAGLIQIDFRFKKGGTGTVFLYRGNMGLFMEQPYQGIYEMDEALERQLRTQIAQELAAQITKQE